MQCVSGQCQVPTDEKVRGNQETFFTVWGYKTSVGSSVRDKESGTTTTCTGSASDGTQYCTTKPKDDGSFSPDQSAPRPRRGHSMVIIDSPGLEGNQMTNYQGYTYLIMFGGRDNDNASFVHIPKTYKVETVNGTVRFATYEDNPVDPCNDYERKWYTAKQIADANCNDGRSHSEITVGIIYNDVWAYRMCTRLNEPKSTPGFAGYKYDGPSTPSAARTQSPSAAFLDPGSGLPKDPTQTSRFFDSPCVGSGWVMLHSGAPEGGCVIQLGILVCTVPSERYNHGSVIFQDGTMYVYGGFSQRCVDYCDDLWFFDIFMKSWRQVYCADTTNCKGDLSHLYTESLTTFTGGYKYYYDGDTKEQKGLYVPLTPPKATNTIKEPWAGPGRRWRFAWVASDQFYKCTKPVMAPIGSPIDAPPSVVYQPLRGAPCEACPSGGKECPGAPLYASKTYIAETVGGPLVCKCCKGPPLPCTVDEASSNLVQCCQDTALFGGHRLWHGYDKENSQENDWLDYSISPPGGYLNDLWVYTKFLDYKTTNGESFHQSDGVWRKLQPIEERVFDGDINDWNNRARTRTFTLWPPVRAGHGLAYDADRRLLWLHGGYSTYFPYLQTDGEGSGKGPIALGIGGFVPYPGYDYFRSDLWYYNLDTGLWRQVEFNADDAVPEGRCDHVFLVVGEILFMHGGFADNYYFDDTWYYNITTSKWLKKERHVYPAWPASCTDDVQLIKDPACVKNEWPKHLDRGTSYPFDILPYQPDGGQNFYWPDQRHGPYFKPLPRGYDRSTIHLDRPADRDAFTKKNLMKPGEAEFPFSALGPMEYARPFTWSLNKTHNATLFERCTSVYAEPTRVLWQPDENTGQVRDPSFDKKTRAIFIPQPRRRAPGWDGCRDRWEELPTDVKSKDYARIKSLPQVLQYQRPSPRAGHRAVFYKSMSEVIMYGGTAYTVEQPKSIVESWPTQVMDDMWYFNLYHCNNNCSDHGICYFGFCQCYVGYYGEDCSNTSCPGTACYYDDYTHDQHCVHACQAGYNHTANDTYVQDIAKIPCNPEPAFYLPGESNGVCDGFGTVQCAPPYLGNDCGTKDCKANCSFNGWCSIEYPVSRCMCQPGYYGEVCENKLCLNNCSYPNGVCNSTTGSCMCRQTYSPYNNTRSVHRVNSCVSVSVCSARNSRNFRSSPPTTHPNPL